MVRGASGNGAMPGQERRFIPCRAFERIGGAVRETGQSMKRIFPLVAMVSGLASASGCGAAGLLRSAAHIPGVAPTDYAFFNFCGSSTQLYQFSVQQVEGSTIEALGDLGFREAEPTTHLPGEPVIFHALTPDGRPAKIKITPQNSLTSVRIEIGPVHLGDGELSRDLLRRIAANFGTAIRAYTPIDPTLPKRLNAPSGFVPRAEHTPPLELKGEGLRPNENRDKAASGEPAIPGDEEAAAGALGLPQGPGQRQGLYWPGVPYPVPPNPYIPFPMPSNDEDAP
jgi:hypothetical protein